MSTDAIARIDALMRRPPAARAEELAEMHGRLVSAQVETLSRLPAAEASRVLGDQTTVQQVVGHVASWERFVTLAFRELLAGVRSPGILRTEGWIEEDGREMRFANPDQFACYVAQRDARREWSDVQGSSLRAARGLHGLLTTMVVAARGLLEAGEARPRRIGGMPVRPMPAGWWLWIAVLWHSGVEHRVDTGLERFELFGTGRCR